MSYSTENSTHTYSAAGWDDESDWGQNDIDTTVIDRDFIDFNCDKVYDNCSNAVCGSSECHEIASEYAWDSNENSVCDADVEEVHSEYAWDADEICSVYAWEAEDVSDCDSEIDENRCSWASAAKPVSEASETSSVYAWEEQENLADWDSEADENQSVCSWASAAKHASEASETRSVYAWEAKDLADFDSEEDKARSECSWISQAKNVLKLEVVYPGYEFDSDDDVVLYAKPDVIRGAIDMNTSTYCKHGLCLSPKCQQERSLPVSNTGFLDDVDCEDDDEEAKSKYAVDFSSKETSSFCERGCCAGPEFQRYCAVPEYDTDTTKVNDNTEVNNTPNIAKLSFTADALELDSPTYCENECCEESECQRYPSSPEDNADFLDEDSEDGATVEENLTEGDSYFGFRMRCDKLKFCTDVRSLHGHFRKIDNDGFEFTDLSGNKINVYFYNDTLHAVQQEYTTWFNFEHLPPVVANTLCAARAAINAVFGY